MKHRAKGGGDMTEKPKRKRGEQPIRPWLRPFTTHPVEFVSPLPLDECVARLREKRTVGRSANRLDVYITRRTPGSYVFLLERTIIADNQPGRKRRQVVRADGEFSYWDETSTLVRCRPHTQWRGWALLGAVIVVLFMLAAIASGEARDIVRAFALAAGFPVAFIIWQFSRTHEHRRLIHMVEDMLRDPIIHNPTK
jgi:hypothetical protein